MFPHCRIPVTKQPLPPFHSPDQLPDALHPSLHKSCFQPSTASLCCFGNELLFRSPPFPIPISYPLFPNTLYIHLCFRICKIRRFVKHFLQSPQYQFSQSAAEASLWLFQYQVSGCSRTGRLILADFSPIRADFLYENRPNTDMEKPGRSFRRRLAERPSAPYKE